LKITEDEMGRLVLTLKPEQRAFIAVGDQEIEVQLVRLEAESIRLGFRADKNKVRIDRESVHDKKTAQQEESAKIDVGSATRKGNQ
jgi:sRNA-binding carbon storage regulator CsrA